MKLSQSQVEQMKTREPNMQPPESGPRDEQCGICSSIGQDCARCRCCGEVFCWRCDTDQAIKARLHTECAFTSYEDDRNRWREEAERIDYQIHKLRGLTCSSVRDSFTLIAAISGMEGSRHRMKLYGRTEA